MLNDVLIKTNLAARVRNVQNALRADEQHKVESDRVLLESDGLVVLDNDPMDGIEKIINSTSPSFTQVNLPHSEVNSTRGISGKVIVKTLRKKS